MSKYDSLRLFLQKQSAPSLTLQFSEIERLVSLPGPPPEKWSDLN
jgi:hypothetical protein